MCKKIKISNLSPRTFNANKTSNTNSINSCKNVLKHTSKLKIRNIINIKKERVEKKDKERVIIL